MYWTEKLRWFLGDKVFDRFMMEFFLANDATEDFSFADWIESQRMDAIDNAFIWRTSANGHDYWLKLSIEWVQFCNETKGESCYVL